MYFKKRAGQFYKQAYCDSHKSQIHVHAYTHRLWGMPFDKCGAHSHLPQLHNADKNAMTPLNATPNGCHQHDNFSFQWLTYAVVVHIRQMVAVDKLPLGRQLLFGTSHCGCWRGGSRCVLLISKSRFTVQLFYLHLFLQ